MQQQLLVSSSPHLRDDDTIPRIMWTVAGALAPAAIMGVVFFGVGALIVIAASIATAVATEALIQKLSGRPVTVSDGSAFVTGLLLAMVLPSSAPIYVPIVGAFVAIAIAKHCFGGLGYNIWNPALIGRAFVQVAWAKHVSLASWPVSQWSPFKDAVTEASPLLKSANSFEFFPSELFLGNVPGSLGETCALALIAGGLFLIIRGYVNWRVPVCFIATAALLAAVLPAPASWADKHLGYLAHNPLYQILAGGLMIGAFFMATDMVTTPITNLGLCIFAAGCGLITMLIRFYGGYPEGVCYSILLMNTTTPLIDRWCKPKVVGG